MIPVCGPRHVNLKRGGKTLGAFSYDEILGRLKEELDARYTLRQTKNDFRNAAEWADVYVYSRP